MVAYSQLALSLASESNPRCLNPYPLDFPFPLAVRVPVPVAAHDQAVRFMFNQVPCRLNVEY